MTDLLPLSRWARWWHRVLVALHLRKEYPVLWMGDLCVSNRRRVR